ncbi:hypothetical protein [Acinetobacter piscicola]|nr:hypothetical protein [Acinetobacter piscicola]
MIESAVIEHDQDLQLHKTVKIFGFVDGTGLKQIIENGDESI